MLLEVELIATVLILIGISLLAYSILRHSEEAKTAPQPKIYCRSCGTANSPEAIFCIKCGKKNENPQQAANSDKSEEKEVDDKEADLFFNAEKDDDLIFPEDGI